jgi:predicted helicase
MTILVIGASMADIAAGGALNCRYCRELGAPVTATIHSVLAEIRANAASTREQGERFERLMQAYLRTDPLYADQFSDVWMWSEWPGNGGRGDTGIDLVARERETGGFCAIQCKFYSPGHHLQKDDIDSFFTASGKAPFTSRLIISTTDRWGKNAEDALDQQQIPVARLGLSEIAQSPVEWDQVWVTPGADVHLHLSPKRRLRPHQRTALDDVLAGFTTARRGKLIMACGTGKTFTSLKIAEHVAADAGRHANVLFLVPSISLLSQALREWTAQTETAMRSFAVCSDTKVGKRSENEDIRAHDLAFPATTDPTQLIRQVAAANQAADMTVIFSTYQSIATVAAAQKAGLPEFDLVICDEAHRTTGVTLAGQDESQFVRVHDNSYLAAARRLYMTATPRLYDDNAKSSAAEHSAVLCSMDDENYGPEFHRLGFGQAVSQGLLTDYKVLILTVDENYIARSLQSPLADDNSELNLDDAVKIVGCWNGLAKRSGTTSDGSGFEPGEVPMRRAVAFSRSIRESRKLTQEFTAVIDAYDAADDGMLRCDVHHVDGTYNALLRNAELDWLKAEVGRNECRILSNARCLSEGVDVPDLDAVLFLNPRNSVVDVVQSVGRVMRKAEGKDYGYIILPVGIPSDMPPDQALADNRRYKVVWQVLQALRAHDDRFSATVNKIDLNKNKPRQIMVGTVGFGDGEDGAPRPDAGQNAAAAAQLALDFHVDEWREAIYAKIVTKVGERTYWENWAKDIAAIADRHVARIRALLATPDSGIQERFDEFLAGLRGNLNDSISRDNAIDMLAQHLITRPVFDALFEDYSFAEHNPVSQVMQAMLAALDENQIDRESETLQKFYASVRLRASGIDNAEGRQRIITELYEKFFKVAFPRVAESLGIVYTPVEIVDFIIRSVERVLKDQFGASISDPGVHVLDPFTGTGTFIVRLLQSGLVSPHDLARKYASELHANEILLLAYYIAAINIEAAYHGLAGGEYMPFSGIVLTDTFQMTEAGDPMDEIIFPDNNERVANQKALDIQVIIGNPPYSVGQESERDNNKNLVYPTLDASIRATYAAASEAGLKRNLYDSYIRAYRWASNRIRNQGIIAFISNGSFIDNSFADGFRKTLASEFSAIYVFNLRGNQRTSGDTSRKEGGKIFGQGSRAPIAITLLIRNSASAGPCQVRYHDVGDYLTRGQKLDAIETFGSVDSVPWHDITPNKSGDWINQRDEVFASLPPLGGKRDATASPLFGIYSLGVVTNRDSWAYNYSRSAVATNMGRMIEFYNRQVEDFARWIRSAKRTGTDDDVTEFIDSDPARISWTYALKKDLRLGESAQLDATRIVPAMYRPYCRQWVYFDPQFNERVYQIPKIFPTPKHGNLVICVSVGEARRNFSVLISDTVPDLHLQDVGAQCFPLHYYEPDDGKAETLFASPAVSAGYRRHDAITDATLARFRLVYGAQITKEDIFYYVYGLLHSADYRQRYSADLKKTMPGIPMVTDFDSFSYAGRTLAALHLGYEAAQPWPLDEITSSRTDASGQYRVQKIRFGKSGGREDKSTIVYNSNVTLGRIPQDAYRYQVNGKSAIEWIMDRYQVRTDTKTGIVNDPNDWANEHGNPRYILDLLKRLVTVSLETMKIVDSLPQLEILP